MNKRNRKLSIEEVKLIPQYLEEGRSYPEIAIKLGVSVRTINYWIRRLKFAGVKLEIKRGRRPLKL